MKIAQKLVSGFIAIALLVGVVGYVAINSGQKTMGTTHNLIENTVSGILALENIKISSLRMLMEINSFVATENESGLIAAEEEAEFLEAKKEVDRWETEYTKGIAADDTIELQFVKEIDIAEERIEDLGVEILVLKKKGISGEEVVKKLNELEKAEEDFLELINKIIRHKKEQFAEEHEIIHQGFVNSRNIVFGTTGLSFLFAIGLGFLIARSILRPIRKLHKGTEVIGRGDLDYRVGTPAKDEVGQLSRAFDKMAENLRKTTTSINKLDKEIAERKKAQAALIDHTRRLAVSNKELDDFTYIISHDLKEPLRSIDAFSKFIFDDYKDKLDKQGKDYLKRIRANTERAGNLIEDLLEISRIEKRKNLFEEVQVQKVVNEAELRLEYAIKEKNVQIVVREKLPKIFCDRVRLTEVFVNLISNAIKFNDKPNPRIEIGSSLKGNFNEFYVKDNGPGIEARYFDKIFEIFQRLARREEYEGTGAGLAIVKKIVQVHKGKIWLESKIGEGTTFYFTIPKEEGQNERGAKDDRYIVG